MIAAMVGQPVDYAIIVTYFLVVLAFGGFFGRFTKTTKDFFFGGQRFSWWLIAISCIATTVGSYSFIKYSAAGFRFGMSSSMTYLNDWFIMPLFFLGWLPIIYFNRIISVPEYFERRFDRKTRVMAVIVLMLYMVGYIGINFYTLGVAMHAMLGIDTFAAAAMIAVVCAFYVAFGGQTAVIMTDLLQGILLLIAGFALLGLGLYALGGFGNFWEALPVSHRLPFADFNQPHHFNFVGIYWQDGVANSIAFYCMNQGCLMRFLSAKSMQEARKVVIALILVLMPLACIATGNAGWIGKAMLELGMLPAGTEANQVFVVVSHALTQPGVFGLIMAALTAALMSTVDTLINAVSTVFVNDIWRPFVVSTRNDQYYLRVARWAAIGTTILGVALVPLFAQFKSIYVAHGAFVATVTPPMVMAILLGALWKRYTATGAFATLLGGSLLMAISLKWPMIISPLAHGIDPAGGFKYMRALYGLLASGLVGVIASLLSTPRPTENQRGLVINFLQDAKVMFKGGEPNETRLGLQIPAGLEITERSKETISISLNLMDQLDAREGDLIYVSDARRWLGGLRSIHARLGAPLEITNRVAVPRALQGNLLASRSVRIEKIL
jgi:solute:Na+ symporter, SSS family